MKKFNLILSVFILILFSSCQSESEDIFKDDSSKSETSSDSSGGGSSGNGGGQQAGVITAGEWNDLDNWTFWNDLLNNQEFATKPDYWSFYTNNRISALVLNNKAPIANTLVELKKEQTTIWKTKTDNLGKAELWIDLYQKNTAITISDYSLYVNNQLIETPLKLYKDGINTIELNTKPSVPNRVELSFVVDATGSMSDELEFLKDDLQDVIEKVQNNNASLNIATSSVFYRDEGDSYVVKHSNFTTSLSETISFINKQSAGGGGDFPEAVHTGLNTAINELQWSENAKTRIVFLILDAPPHYNTQVIKQLQNTIKTAANKGIKLIPISASGIDKNTEFLLRFFSIATNGTYVFITNDSGVGNDHITPSVGEYQVEKLNELMVRLIKKYTD